MGEREIKESKAEELLFETDKLPLNKNKIDCI